MIAEMNLEKQSADFKARLQKLLQELKDSQTEVSKAKEVIVSVKDLEDKLASSQKKI